ncbi:MAG TPA: P-loop NTPase [Clostridiaceae bacterium]|nr:P-loop NTPase [Clostridiaceae bacterium]
MSESCGNNCGPEETAQEFDFTEHLNEHSSVKKVIGVVSGKGGVGKSLVTSLLAVAMTQRGYKTAIMDADITGSSIPKMFGLSQRARSNQLGIYPVTTKTGIEVMSMNLLLKEDTDPVIWRGPLIAGVVKQFWTDVIWDDIDYMFIDMPPGTGDVPLTVFQSIAVDGIVVVTSPQELVSMIVEKAVNMADMMEIPVLGLVENMAYFRCPDNGKDYALFGDSHIEEIAGKHHLDLLARLPVDPRIARASDAGEIEDLENDWFAKAADLLEESEEEKTMVRIAVASEGDKITGHFGHCRNFNLFDTEGGKIVKFESVDNPGHKPGFLPKFLHEQGVNIIISGGIGGAAVDLFCENGIDVISGAQGDARAAVEAYLAGTLVSSGSVCRDHQHEGECGD